MTTTVRGESELTKTRARLALSRAALIAVLALWVAGGSLPRVAATPPSAMLGVCPTVPNTPSLTIAYGTLTVAGSPAPEGTVVEARSPRGDTVGCFVVKRVGHYGTMFVYGEDPSASPVIPGMRAGETVAFVVDGVLAEVSPALVWRDDKDPHEVHLSASTPGPTPTTPPALAGDMDGDCDVDVVDIMLVAAHWGTFQGQANYDAQFDLDHDGNIDVIDVVLVAIHWSEACTG
jgi:hypothetical protein